MRNDVITIEQRLQEPPRILLFPMDEGLALLIPAVLGLVMRQALLGALVALCSYFLWKRLKGESGIEALLAAIYWFFPSSVTPYRSLPDSSVSIWRG